MSGACFTSLKNSLIPFLFSSNLFRNEVVITCIEKLSSHHETNNEINLNFIYSNPSKRIFKACKMLAQLQVRPCADAWAPVNLSICSSIRPSSLLTYFQSLVMTESPAANWAVAKSRAVTMRLSNHFKRKYICQKLYLFRIYDSNMEI